MFNKKKKGGGHRQMYVLKDKIFIYLLSNYYLKITKQF